MKVGNFCEWGIDKGYCMIEREREREIESVATNKKEEDIKKFAIWLRKLFDTSWLFIEEKGGGGKLYMLFGITEHNTTMLKCKEHL